MIQVVCCLLTLSMAVSVLDRLAEPTETTEQSFNPKAGKPKGTTGGAGTRHSLTSDGGNHDTSA